MSRGLCSPSGKSCSPDGLCCSRSRSCLPYRRKDEDHQEQHSSMELIDVIAQVRSESNLPPALLEGWKIGIFTPALMWTHSWMRAFPPPPPACSPRRY